VAIASEQRANLEEVVRPLESIREGIGGTGKPGFGDGRVDARVVTALSAARAVLNVIGQHGDPLGADEPGR
jgi:hypothetical protein